MDTEQTLTAREGEAGAPEGQDQAAEPAGPRELVYCIVPAELAADLHDLLRRHFRDDPGVEVIVEQRFRERRRERERRAAEGQPPEGVERRLVRGEGGRRVGERRARAVPLEPPPGLPRRARRHAEDLAFVRRVEPAGERAEDLDTARLVSRIQAGDADAFGDLYARYFDRVYGYLRVVIRDAHEAEDLTQQVFLDLMGALPGYERRRQPFRAWMFTVVRNRARMHLRSQSRVEVTDPHELERAQEDMQAAEALEAVEPEEPFDDLDNLDWIADRDLLLFVERLPIQQRQVLVMRYLLDLPHQEVAKALGTTPDAVRALQYRAAKTLRDRLAGIGRTSATRRDRAPMKAGIRQAPVLRNRRFALYD